MSNEASETWYRGEGAGVAPAKPGGHLHDFGDGMYLTDREDIAKTYASRRAASADGQKVWRLNITRSSLGRVLDLSMDIRWQTFMNDRTDKFMMGKSRLDFLKIKHELYGQYFAEFLKKFKLNINNFDVVIGPEYNLGGRQMCILHKNGQPATLALRIRALFRPLTNGNWSVGVSKVDGKTATVNVPKIPSARIRFLKGAGSFVGGMGIMIIINIIGAKLIQKLHQQSIEKQIAGFDTEIDKQVNAKKREILDLGIQGKTAYAIVTFTIVYYYSMDIDPGGGGWDQSAPSVKLTSVIISDKKQEGPGETVTERSFGQRVEHNPVAVASEVSVTNDELDSYREALKELTWYDATLKNPNITSTDIATLAAERRVLEKQIIDSFGPTAQQQFELALQRIKDQYGIK